MSTATTETRQGQYRLTIEPARQGRRTGWRVQVYALDSTTPDRPLLNESRLPWATLGPFRLRYESALHLGVGEVYAVHEMDHGTDEPPVQVIWIGTYPVLDNRPAGA